MTLGATDILVPRETSLTFNPDVHCGQKTQPEI